MGEQQSSEVIANESCLTVDKVRDAVKKLSQQCVHTVDQHVLSGMMGSYYGVGFIESDNAHNHIISIEHEIQDYLKRKKR